VSSTLVVKQCGIDSYEWLQVGAGDASVGRAANNTDSEQQLPLFVGDGERLQQQAEQVGKVILLASARQVSIRQLPFEEHERKLLNQTLPYTLEDDCVDEVETLHFALGSLQGNSAPVAIIKREQLQQALADIEQQGVEVKQLVSELSFIPYSENSWSILVNGDSWLVRSGPYQGFALDAATISLGLQLLLDEAALPPERVTLYCPADQQVSCSNLLPELLKGVVDWQGDDYWQVINKGLQQASDKSAINLLQGEFARRLPWLRWWKLWRLVVILLVAAVVVQLASTYTELTVLESQNLQLRTEIERSYRTAIPRGAVMDPEKQLRRKVNALKGSGGDGFVRLLEKVAPVIAAIEGMNIQNLNYSEKQSEIRLTVLAAGFDDVETARNNLEKQGLKAELTGSSADGNKTRARLKIRG
jgi:type II secretion system protein L